jgi:excisionase family DNA binding protein
MEQNFCNVTQAAEYLNLSKNTVYILARQGIIPSIRPLPKKLLFYYPDLKNYLLNHRHASDAEILKDMK